MIEQRIAHTPRDAHAAVTALYAIAKAKTAAGKRVMFRLVELDPEWRHQLRKAFHGPILRDISEQVVVRDPDTGLGVRYSRSAWKTFFKWEFLEGGSTEALADDEYAEFLLQVQAFGVIDLRVDFQEESDRGAH